MKIFKWLNLIFIIFLLMSFFASARAVETEEVILDDKALLASYTMKYYSLSMEILMEMIKDDTLSTYKIAAAVRAFKEKYADEIFGREKIAIEKILLRRLNRSDSVFIQVEILHTLCLMDRYKYFPSMVPILVRRLDHYNTTVSDMSYSSLMNIIAVGHNRPREARIIFNYLRQSFLLSRKKLQNVTTPDEQLKHKLELMRWSIKVLGTQELKKLPSEAINLL